MKHGFKVIIEHYKEHWYIKYLIWGVGIIVFCAILVHVFKELGYTPAREIFGFFDDWATILSASIMLLLAGVAVWAIMDNRYGRIVDRKERLLNEIIDWAGDVARLNFKIYNLVEDQVSKKPWVESVIGEVVPEFQVIEAKGFYIESITLSSFKEEKNLIGATKAVNKEIRELVDVSVKRLDGKVTSEKVSEHMNLLRTKITELLKETAKIKTKV